MLLPGAKQKPAFPNHPRAPSWSQLSERALGISHTLNEQSGFLKGWVAGHQHPGGSWHGMNPAESAASSACSAQCKRQSLKMLHVRDSKWETERVML